MTGRIRGTVSTDEGDGIEEATITVADAATEELEATTTTDEIGEYSVSVAPDTYDVWAEQIGFAPDEERVTVGSGVTKTVDLTLVELSADVVGKVTDGPGIGVLGTVTDDSGASIGVQGEVVSDTGYGLYTPNDARIDGTVDTVEMGEVTVDGERSLRLAAAKEVEYRLEDHIASGSAVIGHLNAVDAGVVGAVISGGGLYNQGDDEPLGNRVTDHFGTIGGGGDNMAGDDDDDPGSAGGGTVGGGFHNKATDREATVAGGRGNEASGTRSSVGGGINNEASGYSSTVGGGNSSTASGRYATVGGGERLKANDRYATVSGGQHNTASDARSTVSGGQHNTASGRLSTVGGGGRNEASGGLSTVGGGRQNTASGIYATVSGGERLEASGARSTVGGGITNTASGERSTVGGGSSNTASGENATIAGGGSFNEASGDQSMVGGGGGNTARGKQSVVGGGQKNEATGPRNTIAGGYENSVAGWTSTVGGGAHNEASGNSSTVSGGWTNTASDRSSTVGGGEENTASGDRATVPGGFLNNAGGDFSFAVGRQAKANHDGAFVFGDSSSTEITSNGSDKAWFQMEVYAPEFNTTSARSAKMNVEPVDPLVALEGVESLDVSTWEFRERDSGRHMGPMAGEFAEMFGLGDDASIATVDSDGVALAAIQGLAQKLDKKDERIADLEERLSAVESEVGSDETAPADD